MEIIDIVEDGEENEVQEHQIDINTQNNRPTIITTSQEMCLFGKQCKRIIDYGRIYYLKNELKLNTQYNRFCDEIYSPECYLLLAKSK